MFCSKCGNELRADDSFCSKCGAEVNTQSNNTVHLTCKNCGSSMTFDDDKQIVACPYCGSKELLIESDDVKIERIKSQTILNKEKMANEFELEKEHYAEELRQKKKTENERVLAAACISIFGFIAILWIVAMILIRL